MTTNQPGPARDITAIPRAVISVAVGVVHSVERAVWAGQVRTARDNAWEAVCADAARARQREELSRRFARAGQPVRSSVGSNGSSVGSSVGSSPRSNADQAARLFGTVPAAGSGAVPAAGFANRLP